MSNTPPPPLDPKDPRAGDPTNPITWIAIGGLIVTVIVIGGINRWNSGAGASTPKAAVVPTAAASPTSGAAAPTGSYKIIFDGIGTGFVDVPNNCQTFKGRTTAAKWHLEYMYGGTHAATPDPATAIVSGTGSLYEWQGGGVPFECTKVRGVKVCDATAVRYEPRVGALKSAGGDRFTLVPPLAGDLTSAAGCDPFKGQDPFSQAWGAWCPPPVAVTPGATATAPNDADCSSLPGFQQANFTIKAGQAGTVVTQIPTKTFEHTTDAPRTTVQGTHSKHSWSGTITVIAQ